MYTSSNGQKISYRGATLWNNLAIGVKHAPSLPVFKQRFLLIRILLFFFQFNNYLYLY